MPVSLPSKALSWCQSIAIKWMRKRYICTNLTWITLFKWCHNITAEIPQSNPIVSEATQPSRAETCWSNGFWRLLWNVDVFYLATISLCRLTIRFAWRWGQVKYLSMSTHQYTFPCKSFQVEKSEANSQLDLLPGSLTLAALGEKGGTVRKAKW